MQPTFILAIACTLFRVVYTIPLSGTHSDPQAIHPVATTSRPDVHAHSIEKRANNDNPLGLLIQAIDYKRSAQIDHVTNYIRGMVYPRGVEDPSFEVPFKTWLDDIMKQPDDIFIHALIYFRRFVDRLGILHIGKSDSRPQTVDGELSISRDIEAAKTVYTVCLTAVVRIRALWPEPEDYTTTSALTETGQQLVKDFGAEVLTQWLRWTAADGPSLGKTVDLLITPSDFLKFTGQPSQDNSIWTDPVALSVLRLEKSHRKAKAKLRRREELHGFILAFLSTENIVPLGENPMHLTVIVLYLISVLKWPPEKTDPKEPYNETTWFPTADRPRSTLSLGPPSASKPPPSKYDALRPLILAWMKAFLRARVLISRTEMDFYIWSPAIAAGLEKCENLGMTNSHNTFGGLQRDGFTSIDPSRAGDEFSLAAFGMYLIEWMQQPEQMDKKAA